MQYKTIILEILDQRPRMREELRQSRKLLPTLELYASVRPVQTLPGIRVPYTDVDLVVVRENTEGLYAGMEHFVVPGVVESLRLVTREAAARIVRYAFEYARKNR